MIVRYKYIYIYIKGKFGEPIGNKSMQTSKGTENDGISGWFFQLKWNFVNQLLT